ncbi:MAG: elongation factor P maturation arginine rhamnosyltransferase EarP [Thiobacillus sp.]
MRSWDIYCTVIDNYGDIGVSWRLARMLAQERSAQVTLWVDDLTVFARIWPAIRPELPEQHCEGVTVRAWPLNGSPVAPAEVVVEAFGCVLPETTMATMSAQTSAPVWINLEYLSAESWVASHHGLPSPHPRLPLTKYFFFPGYDPQTGGLLREHDLLTRCAKFQASGMDAYWARLGLPVAEPDEWRISLFAYETQVLEALLAAWSGGDVRVSVLVPEGRIVPQLAAWLDQPGLQVGDVVRRGALTVHVLPFVRQDEYDALLWACDLNFVRGEDSCVRAQWAARPLVWQAYPQAASAHVDKLNALLALYVARLPPEVAQAVTDCWQRWNGVPDAPEMAACWAALQTTRTVLARHAVSWQAEMAQLPELAGALAEFAENRLKSRAFSNP